MVRTYERKGSKMKWSEEDMEKVIRHAKHHKIISAAAKLFNVPRTTLHDRLSGRVAKEAKVGHPTVLTAAEEAEVLETCMLFAELGFGLGRREVESVIQDYLRVTKKANPFKDEVPDVGWWAGFLKRHPQLATRKPQQLPLVRARTASPEVINHWFTTCLKPVLVKLELMEKPDRIYNVDGSRFPLSWNPKMVFARRRHKAPQAMIPGSGWEQITVQTCISASGQLLPPYVVYKGKQVSPYNTIGGPLGSRYKSTDNGWMDTETFVDCFKTMFLSSLPPARPVLLLLDGHKSHITYEVRQLAIENNVHMLKFPPHTIHLLQLLDLGVFNQMKRTWAPSWGSSHARMLILSGRQTFLFSWVICGANASQNGLWLGSRRQGWSRFVQMQFRVQLLHHLWLFLQD